MHHLHELAIGKAEAKRAEGFGVNGLPDGINRHKPFVSQTYSSSSFHPASRLFVRFKAAYPK